jgi:DNA-binding NarL/FixJ family response regulator
MGDIKDVPPDTTAELGHWPQHAVLVVDDEEGMRSFLVRALAPRFGLVESAPSAEAAAELAVRFHFDVVVLDIALPGKSGVEWLRELKAGGFPGDVIMITAYADLETAIEALRAGAADFILKPFRLDQLLTSVKRSIERQRLARENFVLRRALAGREGVAGMVGQSPPMQQVRALVRRLAPLPSTVLVLGESGSGKEVAARALHQLSPRSARPFVPVNCAAISPELIESELFDLPRRDRGAAGADPDEAPARPRGPAHPPGRVEPRGAGGRAHHRRDQPRPRGGGRQRAVPRGPLLPAQRGERDDAVAARAARGRADARAALHGAACTASRRRSAADHARCRPGARLLRLARERA